MCCPMFFVRPASINQKLCYLTTHEICSKITGFRFKNHFAYFPKKCRNSKKSQYLPSDMKAKHCFCKVGFHDRPASWHCVFMFCAKWIDRFVQIPLKIVSKAMKFHSFFVVPSRSRSMEVDLIFIKIVVDMDSYSVDGVSKRWQLV